MSRIRIGVPLLLAALLAGGCLVRSVHPWLPDASRIQDPALPGVWRDDPAKTTVRFTADGDGYAVADTDGQGRTSRLVASLHRVGETLLLQVGPADPEGFDGFVLLPAQILYRVALAADSLALHPIDPETFGPRAAEAGLALLAESSPDDGYVLTGAPADVEAFLRAHLADPGFFAEKPQYAFRRAPAPVP